MSDTIHVWQEDRVMRDGFATIAVVFELPDQTRTRVWYRVPEAYVEALTQVCDPFLAGYIFHIMRHSDRCLIHGQASPSFLRNLEEFQTAWSCWRPTLYRPAEIVAEVEQEPAQRDQTAGAIIGFSGGVDSSFSVWRHRADRCGRQRQNLVAGVFVHGFGIALGLNDAYERAATRLGKMLDTIGMMLIPMATNLRQVCDVDNWWDAHVAVVASSLGILAGGYSAGLVAACYPYQSLHLPWGSNPITDNLLSSDSFPIINDGAGFTRPQKVRALINWKEGLRYLRVCSAEERGITDRNCGRCNKCRRTILDFRSAGLTLPTCFERDLSNWQVLTHANPREITFIPEMFQAIKANRIASAWVWALHLSYWKSRVQLGVERILSRDR